jgi:hypothetical protein
MANTALVGDNHHMFHQVEPVGPFEEEMRLVTAKAELAPANDGSGDWAVRDRGEVVYRAPLVEGFRLSVLWKADVYENEKEYRRLQTDTLSLEDVAAVFDRDLTKRGERLRFDLDRLEDPSFADALNRVYPAVVPVGARPSIYDAA